MKKLLSMLGAITLIGTVSTNVMACVDQKYSTSFIKTQQDNIYINEFGHKIRTNKRDLLTINTKKVIQIGFFQNFISGEIQTIRMPKTVEIVPHQLPPEINSLHVIFYQAKSFNGNISKWNTSNVKNMGCMFYQAESFNGNISKWKTSKVTNMEFMFYGAHLFHGDI